MFTTMMQVKQPDMSRIDIVFLNNVDMAAAIGGKSIDAIVTWEPQPSLLEAKGLVRVIQRGGKHLKDPGCVMFGTEYVKKNCDVVRRFVKAHFRIA